MLETTCSTLEDIALTHLLSDKEDCQLSVGPRARKGSAAGAGCGAIASVVFKASMAGQDTVQSLRQAPRRITT